jgi:hypothetical protein
VIARGYYRDNFGGGEALDDFVKKSQRLNRWDCAVKNVAGDDYGINRAANSQIDKEFKCLLLRLLQPIPVQGTPKVPIRGVQQSHGATLPGV